VVPIKCDLLLGEISHDQLEGGPVDVNDGEYECLCGGCLVEGDRTSGEQFSHSVVVIDVCKNDR
jgi:hypothetical protein